MAKTFKDLTEKDSIYQINPITQEIEGLKIKEIKGVPAEKCLVKPALKYWVYIEVYRKDSFAQSATLEAIPTIVYFLDGRNTMQLVMAKTDGFNMPVPVPMSADLKALKEWKTA